MAMTVCLDPGCHCKNGVECENDVINECNDVTTMPLTRERKRMDNKNNYAIIDDRLEQ